MPRGSLEGVAIVCMAVLAGLALYWLKVEGKDIALSVTSCLGGYIGGRAVSHIVERDSLTNSERGHGYGVDTK